MRTVQFEATAATRESMGFELAALDNQCKDDGPI